MTVQKLKLVYLILLFVVLAMLVFPGLALAEDGVPPEGETPVVEVTLDTVTSQLGEPVATQAVAGDSMADHGLAVESGDGEVPAEIMIPGIIHAPMELQRFQ